MKNITLLLTFSIYCLNSFGQINKSKLTGEWELVKEENSLKSNEVISIKTGKTETVEQKKQDITLNFKKNKAVSINQNQSLFDANYEIKNDTLLIGDRLYKINKLTEDSLIMSEIGLLPTTFLYIKK